MGIEIERKFLVDVEKLMASTPIKKFECQIRQGYLSVDPARTVRVRIEQYVDLAYPRAFLTVKGMSTEDGLSRPEWEYRIDARDAEEMIAIAVGVVSKRRIVVGRFEVDIFDETNDVVMPAIAEIELSSPNEDLGWLPEWIGEEVTGDPRYYNSNMVVSNNTGV